MTLTDEHKTLNNKIKANQAQYDLDREAAKISALSSKELDKYEYLADEDLGYKPGVVEQAKFEYSSLDKVSNKRLEKRDKKEGLLKRLKNVEGKNKEQLEEIKYQRERQLNMIDKHGKKHLNTIEKQPKKHKGKVKSDEIEFLKDVIYGKDGILLNYYKNFSDKGKNILEKIAADERMINYNNLFF